MGLRVFGKINNKLCLFQMSCMLIFINIILINMYSHKSNKNVLKNVYLVQMFILYIVSLISECSRRYFRNGKFSLCICHVILDRLHTYYAYIQSCDAYTCSYLDSYV